MRPVGSDSRECKDAPRLFSLSARGDVDGDGDIDLVTQPWEGDLHLFVENRLASPRKPIPREAP